MKEFIRREIRMWRWCWTEDAGLFIKAGASLLLTVFVMALIVLAVLVWRAL